MTNVESAAPEARPLATNAARRWDFEWSAVVAGAITAAAVSSILITFATAVGLGVSSASPTWRDASFALWLLSGIYLVLQALVSFGCGGYVAGHIRSSYAPAPAEEIERRDGWHGIISWALAILIGVCIAALLGLALERTNSLTSPPPGTEPSVLSYDIDHLLRAPRRLPTAELMPIRSEAGRILLTSSSHNGVTSDDRTYLTQLVSGATGLTGADANRRVDTAIANARKSISHARASSIILAFSLATSLLLGGLAAWAGAEAGGRHRDGMPLPHWMKDAERFNRRRTIWERRSPLP